MFKWILLIIKKIELEIILVYRSDNGEKNK